MPQDIGTDGLDDLASWDEVINPKGRDKENEDAIIFQVNPERRRWRNGYGIDPGADEEQTDGLIATEAIAFLKRNRNRPFFLGVGSSGCTSTTSRRRSTSTCTRRR